MAEEIPRLPDPNRGVTASAGAAQIASQPSGTAGKERVLFVVFACAAALLGAVVFFLPPAGFWSKLSALGYSVCHQIPERSFFVHTHQFPLCARCTGMYLGALLSLGWHFLRGRRNQFPPLALLLTLSLIFLAFALDGLNSLRQVFLPMPALYHTTNLIRLITGFGAGICIGTVLGTVFNQAVWSNPQPGAALDTLPRLLALLGAAALLGWAVYSGPDWLKAPLAVLSGAAVPVVLAFAYTVLLVMLLGRANTYQSWQQLRLPLALGLCAALLQILIMSLLRLWLTGSWAAIPL